ncbi:manganese peroxidase isozyme precursor [Mucidula mucida]|nr:manganese peroxidase isozyme precursor [Mucidula mucida]
MAFLSILFVLSLFSSSVFSALVAPRDQTCDDGTVVSDTKCCIWYSLYDELRHGLFNSVCDEVASDAIRLAFHDAIGYSPALTEQGKWGGGGADGSIMTFASPELGYAGNKGLQTIAGIERIYADLNGVSYGDIIQFANAVALTICPGAPRLEFFAGRPKAVAAAPESLLPSASAPVDELLARFKDAGFNANELVDLLASHSVAFQEHVDPTIPFTPMDSTPGTFDAQFYVETLLNGTAWPGDGEHPGEAKSPLDGEFRLMSDHRLARDPRTSCRWQSFIKHPEQIAPRFKKAMEKIALVGQDKYLLTDCSEAIGAPVEFSIPDAHLPAGKTLDDIEASCEEEEFPSITADPGPSTAVPTPTHIENDFVAPTSI